MKQRYKMPRPRKYDYKKDYPVKLQLHLRLSAAVLNSLEELGYDREKMSKEVQEYFTKIVENRKKDVD